MLFVSSRILLISIALLAASFGHAANDEVAYAKRQLERQLNLMTNMEQFIERPDLARLFVLKSGVMRTAASVNQLGLSHMTTMREYQNQIVAFRFSKAYFRQISSKRAAANIAELVKLNDEIVALRGFDDSPYTKITSSTFNQMYQLTLQLLGKGPVISDQLSVKLNALKPLFGRVLSVAAEGDRPTTFREAGIVYKSIKDLYPEFNKIMSSHVAFNIVLEIQGLNEFYAEFAQINE